MLDPSFACSEEGVAWLEEDERARREVVVSAVFAGWLRGVRDLDPTSLVSREDLELLDGRLERLRVVLGDVATFSHADTTLSREHEAVRVALLELGGPIAEIYADEWAFLQSHSFMVSKLRRVLDAFRDAGGVIVEFGRTQAWQLVEGVIPAEQIPPALTGELIAKVAAKWIVVGGASVGGGTLGGIAGTMVGGPVGTAVGHFVGGLAGRRISKAAVLAIDP